MDPKGYFYLNIYCHSPQTRDFCEIIKNGSVRLFNHVVQFLFPQYTPKY